jgi:drug/metabolite transporter (DMT)-like permease
MDWFVLTLILSCTGSTLVLSMRAITRETNPFLFMGCVTGIAGLVLVVFCTLNHISLQMDPTALRLAVMAGFSVAILDVAFIMMFRKGAQVSTSMQIFRVMSIVLSAVIGLLVFKEALNPVKIGGILTACMAVYLLYSKPKESDVK